MLHKHAIPHTVLKLAAEGDETFVVPDEVVFTMNLSVPIALAKNALGIASAVRKTIMAKRSPPAPEDVLPEMQRGYDNLYLLNQLSEQIEEKLLELDLAVGILTGETLPRSDTELLSVISEIHAAKTALGIADPKMDFPTINLLKDDLDETLSKLRKMHSVLEMKRGQTKEILDEALCTALTIKGAESETMLDLFGAPEGWEFDEIVQQKTRMLVDRSGPRPRVEFYKEGISPNEQISLQAAEHLTRLKAEKAKEKSAQRRAERRAIEASVADIWRGVAA